MLATEFGELHKSCPEAMKWRRSLPPTATQADAYLACDRGDWLFWQLERLPREQYDALRPAIQRVLEKIVTRAIRRVLASIEGIEEPWAEGWRRWADRWLSGEDRSKASALMASASWNARPTGKAAWLAAWLAEGACPEVQTTHLWRVRASWLVAQLASSAVAVEASSAEEAVRVASARVTDMRVGTVWLVARLAAEAAGSAAEECQQAEDTRREIPIWPGE